MAILSSESILFYRFVSITSHNQIDCHRSRCNKAIDYGNVFLYYLRCYGRIVLIVRAICRGHGITFRAIKFICVAKKQSSRTILQTIVRISTSIFGHIFYIPLYYRQQNSCTTKFRYMDYNIANFPKQCLE